MKGRTVLPAEGVSDLLELLIGKTTWGGIPWYMILYSEPIDPTQATVWADVEECTFSGYSRRSVSVASWTAPTVSAGVATTTWHTIPQSFTNGGSQTTVAGYALIRAIAPVVYFIYEPTEVATLESGDVLQVLPRLTLATDTCTVFAPFPRKRGRPRKV
jgi:hypothetical protein